eukprot:CAMPEP_0114978216 /NCGR_PEP_ID=MMETSP0216-20121206/3685_1 /TAXON_ID=223996 /ORGANISM="Protocruzia adherens, Strain Boccale" /LENGTH=197 /DNA_ID=CAMNT_0002339391 /DNA_START=484 /DNA_END=1077 /DNA_ORIENTATION=-
MEVKEAVVPSGVALGDDIFSPSSKLFAEKCFEVENDRDDLRELDYKRLDNLARAVMLAERVKSLRDETRELQKEYSILQSPSGNTTSIDDDVEQSQQRQHGTMQRVRDIDTLDKLADPYTKTLKNNSSPVYERLHVDSTRRKMVQDKNVAEVRKKTLKDYDEQKLEKLMQDDRGLVYQEENRHLKEVLGSPQREVRR